MSTFRFLSVNGVVVPSFDAPPVSTLLEANPGVYTTSRTVNNGSQILFWNRHLTRLSDSARILFNSNPQLLFKHGKSSVSIPSLSTESQSLESSVRRLVNSSLTKVMPVAFEERKNGEELAITALLSGNYEKLSEIQGLEEFDMLSHFDVYVHVGFYVPHVFGIRETAAHLAAVGYGRAVANAKYSDWVRLRRPLEKLRPPLATELLLSNDGDQMLEGSVTNFFVVCHKETNEGNYDSCASLVEVQTTPLGDGVLPGIIRQVIMDVCSRNGIPLREVAPSWSKREMWEEAFITSSLRLLQHVETIRVPNSWESIESKTWADVTWEEKQFEERPGRITSIIQEEVMKRAGLEGYPVASL